MQAAQAAQRLECHNAKRYAEIMSKFSAADVLDLTVEERLRLVEDIWDTIADAPQRLELTEEDKQLIDERLKERERNPRAGAPWADAYARITSRNR